MLEPMGPFQRRRNPSIPGTTIAPRDFLKVSRAEYDRLLESSPGIDQDIIALFNKKFNTSYPNVSKPIICNGLQEVKVYQDSVSMGGEEESAAENAQP
eukprot:COSAG02_NODE_1918_length_10386_cov_16.728492_5_plen_98_part_00